MVKIGLLSRAHLHADSYAAALSALPNADLVGVWDDDAARGEAGAAKYGTRFFGERNDLLQACDAVLICSENVKHRQNAEAASRAGKHILCEKPLATTPDDAKAMVEVAEQNGVLLFTAFPCRFSPPFEQLKAAVERGDIGGVWAVRGTNRGKCPFGWFVDKALSGGGAVMDHTVHVTDLLRVLLQSEVREVFCENSNAIHHKDFDDTGFLALNFENGVFATLDASWSRPQTFPTWGDVTMGVTGEKGVLEMDMFAQAGTLYSDKNSRVSLANWGSDMDSRLVAAFVRSVETGSADAQLATGTEGLRAVEVVEAAYKSAETHQPVKVAQR